MSKQSIRTGGTNYFHLNGKVDPISEIVNAGILTTGDVYWVKDIDDADYIEFKDRVGRQFVYTDIQSAIDKCVADQNDYVMVCPKDDGAAWHVLRSVGGINLNKDKVHLIGVGASPNNTDYGVVLQGFGTAGVGTAAGGTLTDDGVLFVSGDGCEVAGIKISATAGTGGGGTLETAACMHITGQAPNIHDVAFEMLGPDWNAGTPAGCIHVGSAVDGGLIDNCEIQYGTKTAVGTVAGVYFNFNNENWTIKNTRFVTTTAEQEDAAIRLAPGTATKGGNVLYAENCSFLNYNSGTPQLSALRGTVMSKGNAMLKDCASLYTAAMGTNALVFNAPAFAGGTINNLIQNPGIAVIGTALTVTKT